MTNRRDVLRMGLAGALTALAGRDALAQVGRRKSCVLLWLNGGPSHLETWDPKPGVPTGGPWKAIATRAPGMMLPEHMPQLAERANLLSLVRSMTSKEGNHDRASYLLHTGYSPNPTVVHPSLGAWVSKSSGQAHADLPQFVSVRGPSFGAGILGVEHGPFVIANPGAPPENTALGRNIDDARFERRNAALGLFDRAFSARVQAPNATGKEEIYAGAARMIKSPRLQAFQIDREPESVKKAYGLNDFGRGVLLARRLVEAGVPFVEVVLDGWDTHADNFGRVKKQLDILDPAMATLVGELSDRHILSDTLVVCMGEFGRTPKINDREGRDHYPQAWSIALAGGGVRGGAVFGATDAAGGKVVEKPVTVPDLIATIETLLGVDPTSSATSPLGRPISASDGGRVMRELFAG